LQKLPVDMVKIDGKLIRGVIHNPVEQSIVESMLRVSTVLGVECVAVSVENSETVTALKQMGMPWLQGFFIGKPEPWA
jgi:EAL domain-containing protein (putative c-di-GMP-specific phosphodiesterase class I)